MLSSRQAPEPFERVSLDELVTAVIRLGGVVYTDHVEAGALVATRASARTTVEVPENGLHPVATSTRRSLAALICSSAGTRSPSQFAMHPE